MGFARYVVFVSPFQVKRSPQSKVQTRTQIVPIWLQRGRSMKIKDTRNRLVFCVVLQQPCYKLKSLFQVK
jgi:hypothetical protein